MVARISLDFFSDSRGKPTKAGMLVTAGTRATAMAESSAAEP